MARFLRTSLLGVLVFAVLIWQDVVSGVQSIEAHEQTELLRVPIPPFRFILGFGFFLSFVALIFQIVNLFRPKKDQFQKQIL